MNSQWSQGLFLLLTVQCFTAHARALLCTYWKSLRVSGSEVTRQTSSPNAEVQFKVAIVDGMAEIQSLDKPQWIKTCKHLAEDFNNRLFSK